MPWFPNPSGGAPIQADTNPNPAGGSLGYYSDPGYSGPPPAGGTSGAPASASPTGATPTVNAQSSQLASGINSLLGAIASGNKQAFDEAVRQYNTTFGLDQQKFAESVRQFNQNYLVSEAGLTGQYQGQETQQAQLQAQNIAAQTAGLTGYYVAPGMGGAGAGAASPLAGYPPGTVVRTANNQFGVVGPGGTLDTNPNNPAIGAAIQAGQGVMTVPDPAFAAGQQAAAAGGGAPGGQGQMTTAYQNQIYTQQMGAINAAAALQANPFRQAQVIGQAGRVLQGLPTAGFGAPNTVAGVGTAGGNTQGGMGYLQQMIDDIKDPTANQTTAQSWLDATPTPNKIDSASFLRSTPTTQNLILQSMQEKYGIDPTDALTQIKNTLPQFSAPQTTGVVRRG